MTDNFIEAASKSFNESKNRISDITTGFFNYEEGTIYDSNEEAIKKGIQTVLSD